MCAWHLMASRKLKKIILLTRKVKWKKCAYLLIVEVKNSSQNQKFDCDFLIVITQCFEWKGIEYFKLNILLPFFEKTGNNEKLPRFCKWKTDEKLWFIFILWNLFINFRVILINLFLISIFQLQISTAKLGLKCK